MLKQIALMEAGVIRGLLVSMVGVIGLVLSLFGVDAAAFGQEASKFIDALMSLLASGGLFYAAYARITMPTPPLTDESERKTAALMRKQGGFASPAILATLALTGLAMISVAGCVTPEPARGFRDRAAVLELKLNAVVVSTTNSVRAGALKAEDAKQVRDLANTASEALGLAEAAFDAGDAKTAEGRITLAEGILRELQQRVKPQQPRAP